LVNLIQNENMKIYRRIRTWVMVVLLVVLVVATSLLMFFLDDGQEMKNGDWRAQLEQQQANFTTELNDKNTSDNQREYINGRLTIIEHHLDNNIPPMYTTMWEPVDNLTDFVLLITLFVVIIAGDSIAGEFSTGTIKLLLIRPASRLKIMLSKYYALILFGVFLLILLFLTSFLVNGLLYGFTGWSLPYLSVSGDGVIQQESTLIFIWKQYLFGTVSTVMYVTFAFMISAVFRSSAMAIGISIFSMYAGMLVTSLFQQYSWSKYSVFANMDLRQYLEGVPFREEMTMNFSIGVLIAYFIIFCVLSWAVFTKRDVAS
jgi:ABC-2 type transport system permease protein